MKPSRRSITSTITDETFARIVSESLCYADIVRSLDLRIQGSNYGTLKRRISRQQLSIAHFDPWNSARRRAGSAKRVVPLEQILIEGSHHGSNDLKKRLVKAGLLNYRCNVCGNEGGWQGKPLILQLDHINGDHSDNRIDNLRILCPNCHTQTKTHSGKRFKGTGKRYECPQCGKERTPQSKRCFSCAAKRGSRFNWPDNKVLQDMLWHERPVNVALKIGCSYTLLRNHCQNQGIQLPGSGYWVRRNHGYSHEEALVRPSPPIPQRVMTQEQIAQAVTLVRDGRSYREVGKALGFCHTTVSRHLRKLVAPPVRET